MIRFCNDYSEGCHPLILQAMADANLEGNPGYSTDPHTQMAAQRIRTACQRPDAAVHILVSGTQTNTTAIAAFLWPWQAVISADTGHICVHETGAIEATGHKCIACPNVDGKLTPEAVCAVMQAHHDGTEEHMVQPAMVYISQTTELGTLYTLSELEALRRVCDHYGLILYLDGARMGSALAAGGPTLPQIAALVDAFYIGGTKNGALMGEALVLCKESLKKDFRFAIKQRGGMFAKGWMLGVQFEVLMENDLFVQLGRHANQMALRLRDGIAALGYRFTNHSDTNQQFVILPDGVVSALAESFGFEVQSKPDDRHTVIRLVTSWATQPESVDAFLSALKALTV